MTVPRMTLTVDMNFSDIRSGLLLSAETAEREGFPRVAARCRAQLRHMENMHALATQLVTQFGRPMPAMTINIG